MAPGPSQTGAKLPRESFKNPGHRDNNDTFEKRLQYVDAYKQAGFGFATVGGGVAVAAVDRVSFNVGLRVGLTFPVVTMVVSPEAGVSLGF